MNAHNKAISMGFPSIDTNGGHESADGSTYLNHFCKTADCSDPGVFVGYNGYFRVWVIEYPE